MFVDIDIPAGTQAIHIMRADGSSTISVPENVFQSAATSYSKKTDAVARDFKADGVLESIRRASA